MALVARILGLAQNLPLAPMERFYRVMWIGFWINVGSGIVLLIADAATKLGRSYVLGPNAALYRQRVLENVFEEDHSSLACARGAVSHLHADGGVHGVGLPRGHHKLDRASWIGLRLPRLRLLFSACRIPAASSLLNYCPDRKSLPGSRPSHHREAQPSPGSPSPLLDCPSLSRLRN